MKKIRLSEVEEGMVLGKPIAGPDGKILLAAGEPLQSSMAGRLQNWGIIYAWVKTDDDDTLGDASEEKEKRLKNLKATFSGVMGNANMKTLYNAIRQHIQEN